MCKREESTDIELEGVGAVNAAALPIRIYGITKAGSEILLDTFRGKGKGCSILDSRRILRYRFQFASGESIERTKDDLLKQLAGKYSVFEPLHSVARLQNNCYDTARQIMIEAWMARMYTVPQCENKVLINAPGLGCVFVDEQIDPPGGSPWIKAACLNSSPTFRINCTCFAEDSDGLSPSGQGPLRLTCAVVMKPPDGVEFVMELAVDDSARDFLFLVCAAITRDFWVGEMYNYEKRTYIRKTQKFVETKQVTYLPRKRISFATPKSETETRRVLAVDIAPYMVCGHLRQLPYG